MKILRTVAVGFLLLFALLLLAIVYMVFATGSPEHVYRTVVWFESDIYDFQRFPYREIDNAPPVFQFEKKITPEDFQTISYTENGEVQEAGFEEFLVETGTTAFIVIKDDAIRYENYFNGFQRDSLFTSFSSAKSFNSALIGIAVDEGLIDSIDDPMVHYLPELKGRGLDEMTIRHLLLMSSGIDYLEDERLPLIFGPLSDDAKTYYFPDMRKLALSVQRGDEPLGAYFHYNNFHPLLEGLILERVSGMPVAEFLQEKIWKPLGMEYSASWSMDSTESGFEKMESGINARAIDFAKFGRLFLNGGNWNGRQIISEAWVKESTAPDPGDQRVWVTMAEAKQRSAYYKYHWWGINKPDGSYDFYAAGHLGQYIYVNPQKNVVIVRYGAERGPQVFWVEIFTQIAERLE